MIGGKSLDEHLELLDAVLQRLIKAGLVIKSKKAFVACRSVRCLGFMLSKEGIQPEQEKVEAIKMFSKPRTLKQLRGFLGMLNFYGGFLQNLQVVVRPLNVAMGSSSKIIRWDRDMEPSSRPRL